METCERELSLKANIAQYSSSGPAGMGGKRCGRLPGHAGAGVTGGGAAVAAVFTALLSPVLGQRGCEPL